MGMTNEQFIIAGVIVGVVVIVFLLKDKIFNIKGSKKGFEIDTQQPVQRPGVEVRDAVARKGSVQIENNAGDGVKAEGLDAGKNVTITNNPRPKQ